MGKHHVTIPSDAVKLSGILGLPRAPQGIVLFAHGSGSGRLSPRNAMVAGRLQEAGFGTLLMDLLMESEAEDRANVFNIPLLARRMIGCTQFVRRLPETTSLPIGYFGASTGAAAALVAAARLADVVGAIVSRGGRPDLAGELLSQVAAPTLLIVGGNDPIVIGMNEEALGKLHVDKDMKIVPGATHLFEEPGALEEVARLAAAWFRHYLRRAA